MPVFVLQPFSQSHHIQQLVQLFSHLGNDCSIIFWRSAFVFSFPDSMNSSRIHFWRTLFSPNPYRPLHSNLVAASSHRNQKNKLSSSSLLSSSAGFGLLNAGTSFSRLPAVASANVSSIDWLKMFLGVSTKNRSSSVSSDRPHYKLEQKTLLHFRICLLESYPPHFVITSASL